MLEILPYTKAIGLDTISCNGVILCEMTFLVLTMIPIDILLAKVSTVAKFAELQINEGDVQFWSVYGERTPVQATSHTTSTLSAATHACKRGESKSQREVEAVLGVLPTPFLSSPLTTSA